jgi:DNA-binding response OmpR family regulator
MSGTLRTLLAARGARPDLTVPDAAVATVVTELARVYLSGLDQPTRAVLDAACDDALLDPDRRQLTLDGARADLTKLEFDVLQYLYEREGRVVGRAALLRDVWGYDWTGGSNVVEVVISALRRKLGDSAGTLQTVRGAGYRFTAPH